MKYERHEVGSKYRWPVQLATLAKLKEANVIEGS